jgi:type IV secretion system protein VirB4
VVVESCANKILLANPNLDRQAYRDLFGLNDTEIDLVASLIPRQQMLVKRSGLSKVLNLHVDAEALALYTNARDTQHDNDCASAAKSAIDVTTGRA